MEVIQFPATNAALWHPKPTGSPVHIHATYYRLPLVVLEERSIRLAQRFSQNYPGNEYMCHLISSVCTDPDAEGVRISIDHIDPGPNQATPDTEDLVLKCLVRTDSRISLTSEHFLPLIQAAHEGCLGKNQYGLRDVMAGMVTCSSQQGLSHIIYSDIDIILPNVVFKATPIQSLPIMITALSKNLAGPVSLSEMQGEAKSGYMTMDQTHRLLLILASDPKATSLPLVGIWVSGVAMVHDPFVWRSCLNYQFSSLLKNRVCRSPEPFLIVLYSSLRSQPEFYQCVTTDGKNDMSFQLYSCHEVIHLQKKPSDRPPSPLELELTLVNSGRKLTLFEAALKIMSERQSSNSSNLAPVANDTLARKSPAAQTSKTSVVQLSLHGDTLLYEDSEPRSHPSAQSPYPPPQPFPQQMRPPKKSKEKRKQSLKSPQVSVSSHVLSPVISSSHNLPRLHPSHQSLQSMSGPLINSYQNSGMPADDGKAVGQWSAQVSPRSMQYNQPENPSYVMSGSANVAATPWPGATPTNPVVVANVQYPGHGSLATYGSTHSDVQIVNNSMAFPPNYISTSSHVNTQQNPAPAIVNTPQQNPAPAIAHTPQQIPVPAIAQHNPHFQGQLPAYPQQSNGANGHLVNSPANFSPFGQGPQSTTPQGFADPHKNNLMHPHGDAHLKSPLASVTKLAPSVGVQQQVAHHGSPRVNHCGDGDVGTPHPCGTSVSYHSDMTNSSSGHLTAPQNAPPQPNSENTSDFTKTQSCHCKCSAASSTQNIPNTQSPAVSVQSGEVQSSDKSNQRPNDNDLYAIVRQQEAQIQILREQISMLLAQQTPTSVEAVKTSDHQASSQDFRNRSVGCNTSGEPEERGHSQKHLDKSIQHSNWPGSNPELMHNQGPSYQDKCTGCDVLENSSHSHCNNDCSNCVNTSSSCMKDHSEDTSSLSFGEFDMNKVHDNSQESVASTMVLDLPEYGPVSPDRSVINNHSHEGSEIGDVSPVPSESVSTCEQVNAEEYVPNGLMDEDSRDTGLGDSNVQPSLLLNDHKLFYKSILENVYKHFLTQGNSRSNDSVVSAPDLNTYHAEMGSQNVQRSYDDCLDSPVNLSPVKRKPSGRKPANVAKITKEALAKLGIEVEKERESASFVKKDTDSMFLDLAQLPRAEFMAMSLDTDSECSVEMDVLAMKYLKDDQLVDSAKLKGRRSRMNHFPATPSKAGSVSNMSYASRKYFERYGILDSDNQSVITAVTEHSLRLPTLFNVQEFLQKLSETSSAVGADSVAEAPNGRSTSSGSDHSHNCSRQSSSSEERSVHQPDPAKMTLNEMGQFLGLSKPYKSREPNKGHLTSSPSPHPGHFPR